MDRTPWVSTVVSVTPPLAALSCCLGSTLLLRRSLHDLTSTLRSKKIEDPATGKCREVEKSGVERCNSTAAAVEDPAPFDPKHMPFRPMSSNKIAQLKEWHDASASPEHDIGLSSTKGDHHSKKRVDVGHKGSTPKQVRLINEILGSSTKEPRQDPPPLELPSAAKHSILNSTAATEQSLLEYSNTRNNS